MPAMTVEFLAWGRTKYKSALAYYSDCLSKNKWPSFKMAGMPYPPANPKIQLIGPEDVWLYKKLSGQGSLAMSENYTPESKPNTPFDVIP